MKNMSIKLKITVWFAVAMLIITGITVSSTLVISKVVIVRDEWDELSRIVEDNVDEIEFYSDFSKLDMDDDYDIYIEYKGGYLEIDDDFMRNVNGISSSIYSTDGIMLYGENPVYKQTQNIAFENGKIRTVKNDAKTKYYIYDRQLNMKGTEDLWLRGIISSEHETSQINSISFFVLLILPVIALIAVFGGYIIAKRALEPVKDLSDSAESIREGNDLSRRMKVTESNSELHSLANSFNGMIDRLEKSFEAEKQLTNDISHELRTPVSVIMSQCEYILEQNRSVKDYEEGFNLVLRQSKKMSKMINDMLSFSKLEKRADNSSFEKLDFSALVSDVCSDMSLIKENNISLHSDIDENINVYGDVELLTRLVVNLISNAYRYGKENGNIFVSVSQNENAVTLSVRDDGIGISESDIEKIWNRFYRADTSRSSKGTGLGLNFVKEIARIHGGKMIVESTEGVGSTFIFKVEKNNFKK